MTDIFYDITDPLFVDLLNVSCNGPHPIEGYAIYRVETHFLAVIYTARPIERDHNGTPTRYAVINRDYEVYYPFHPARG